MPDYGNWISKSVLITFMGLFVMALFCLAVVFLPAVREYIYDDMLLWTLRAALFVLCCLTGGAFIIFYLGHQAFSDRGGGASSRILDYVMSYVNWNGRGKALDIGCGSGALTIRVALKFPNAKVTGMDFFGKGWGYSKKQCERNASLEGVDYKTEFICGDAASLPFPDNEYELVVSNFVFHEVKSQPDKRLVIKEALRVVKPGGQFVFHDLFYDKHMYGKIGDLKEYIQGMVSEVDIKKTTTDEFGIRKRLWNRIFLRNTGIIYGIK